MHCVLAQGALERKLCSSQNRLYLLVHTPIHIGSVSSLPIHPLRRGLLITVCCLLATGPAQDSCILLNSRVQLAAQVNTTTGSQREQ